MADVKQRAHELAIHVAGLASLEARMRKQMKEKSPELDLDEHGAQVGVPVELLKSISKVGEQLLTLLSDISLIDPMRVKEEFSKKAEEVERDVKARQQLMQMLKGKLSSFFGLPEDMPVEVVTVGPKELMAVAKAAARAATDAGDSEEECGCPNCTMRREVLNGNLNVDGLDLPPGVKQVLKDYADAVREEAAEEGETVVSPNASLVAANPRILH